MPNPLRRAPSKGLIARGGVEGKRVVEPIRTVQLDLSPEAAGGPRGIGAAEPRTAQ